MRLPRVRYNHLLVISFISFSAPADLCYNHTYLCPVHPWKGKPLCMRWFNVLTRKVGANECSPRCVVVRVIMSCPGLFTASEARTQRGLEEAARCEDWGGLRQGVGGLILKGAIIHNFWGLVYLISDPTTGRISRSLPWYIKRNKASSVWVGGRIAL